METPIFLAGSVTAFSDKPDRLSAGFLSESSCRAPETSVAIEGYLLKLVPIDPGGILEPNAFAYHSGNRCRVKKNRRPWPTPVYYFVLSNSQKAGST
jgi:hypothetical protein